MARLVIHAVRVIWADGRRETMRYETEDQARRAARYQEVENWRQTTSATYLGPRPNWRWPLDVLMGR